MSKKEYLLSQAISEHSVRIDPANKNYTIPVHLAFMRLIFQLSPKNSDMEIIP